MQSAGSRTRTTESSTRSTPHRFAAAAATRRGPEGNVAEFDAFRRESEARAQRSRSESQKPRVLVCALLQKALTFELQIWSRLQEDGGAVQEIEECERKMLSLVDRQLLHSVLREIAPSVGPKLRAGDSQLETLRMSLDVSINELFFLSQEEECLMEQIQERQREQRLRDLEYRIESTRQWFLEMELDSWKGGNGISEIETYYSRQESLLDGFEKERDRLATFEGDERADGGASIVALVLRQGLDYVAKISSSIGLWLQSISLKLGRSPECATTFAISMRLVVAEKHHQRIQTVLRLASALMKRMLPLPNMGVALEDLCLCVSALVKDSDSLEEEVKQMDKDLKDGDGSLASKQRVVQDLQTELLAKQQEKQKLAEEVAFLESRFKRILEIFPSAL